MLSKTLRLVGMEFLTQLNGKGFEDLPRDLQRVIEESQVVVNVIDAATPHEVKFILFKRINTVGISLSSQEIRNALYQGIPSKFVEALAELSEFKLATNQSLKNNHRMLDRDFANRFLAFYLGSHSDYEPDLDTYLTKALEKIAVESEAERERILEAFRISMQLNREVFGEFAFRKFDIETNEAGPLNKALFDVLSVLFARLSSEQRDKVRGAGNRIRQDFSDLLKWDPQFLKSITSGTGSKSSVVYRFETAQKAIAKYL